MQQQVLQTERLYDVCHQVFSDHHHHHHHHLPPRFCITLHWFCFWQTAVMIQMSVKHKHRLLWSILWQPYNAGVTYRDDSQNYKNTGWKKIKKKKKKVFPEIVPIWKQVIKIGLWLLILYMFIQYICFYSRNGYKRKTYYNLMQGKAELLCYCA